MKYVKGVSTLSLFFHQCPCGELNIHGFWQQLQKEMFDGFVRVTMPCRKCGMIRKKKYRLTTSKRNHAQEWKDFILHHIPMGLFYRFKWLQKIYIKLAR